MGQINKNNQALKFSNVTSRQYMALSLIYSLYNQKSKYPTRTQLKEVIGFKTERMLDITLNSLHKKGLLFYNENNKEIRIRKEMLLKVEEILEPSILTNDFINFKDLKSELINLEKIKHNFIFTQQTLETWSSLDKSEQEKYILKEKNIVNRWYSYLADFPVSLVQEKLEEYKLNKESIVLDPFSGSGTTLVASKIMNINNIGIDINPVASFVSSTKTNWNIEISDLKKTIENTCSKYQKGIRYLKEKKLKSEFLENMGYIEANQWLKPKTQNEVALIKELIDDLEDDSIKNLLKLALIEATKKASNVSFCPGTSFYPLRKKPDFYETFYHLLGMMVEDLTYIKKQINSYGKSQVFTYDCRRATEIIEPNRVDFILTSPPYPNDMEYTRQTRLDMFLLDYVKNLDDVQKIKKKMVKGSTKLIYKDSNSARFVEDFESIQNVATKVAESLSDRKWGWDYPRMIREYFGDMLLTLAEFKKLLKKNSYALLVVGDQTYKKNLIPVGDILLEIGNHLGFSKNMREAFRMRNSTLHKIPLKEEILIFQN